MNKSSFLFLATRHHDLLEPILRAESYAHHDPVTSLMRTRQFLELFVLRHLLDEVVVTQCGRPGDGLLKNALQRALNDGYLTDDEHRHLNEIRQWGNDATHRNHGSVAEALTALSRCYSACARVLGSELPAFQRPPSRYKPVSPPTTRPAGMPAQGLRAWVIRPYPHYTDCRAAFRQRRLIAIGWHLLGGLEGLTVEQVMQRLQATFPKNQARWDRDLETILLFRDTMRRHDLVIMAPYRKDEERVAVGQVDGKYKFRPSQDKHDLVLAQQRSVIWHGLDEPRNGLPDSIQRSIRKLTLVETDVHDLLGYCEERGYKLRQPDERAV